VSKVEVEGIRRRSFWELELLWCLGCNGARIGVILGCVSGNFVVAVGEQVVLSCADRYYKGLGRELRF
jgi:hypothetical protein